LAYVAAFFGCGLLALWSNWLLREWRRNGRLELTPTEVRYVVQAGTVIFRLLRREFASATVQPGFGGWFVGLTLTNPPRSPAGQYVRERYGCDRIVPVSRGLRTAQQVAERLTAWANQGAQ
jgi:hypothetical protein